MLDENFDFLVVKGSLPHLAAKIQLFWGHPDLDPFIKDLFLDSRDGIRQGLPKVVATSIFRLAALHEETFPHLYPTTTGWISAQL